MNFSTGALKSKKDKRTVKYTTLSTEPLTKGGVIHIGHEHQHLVGICTAISRTQLRTKQTGKRYSAEFQYLCQKYYYDKNWKEGSSILVANKVAKNIGFLPEELWTYTTEQDRFLAYDVYIEKLKKAIPDLEKLKTLCIDKIAGYTQVNVNDAQEIAKAIMNSPNQQGILCRYGCQKNWWTPSWLAKDINPLRYAPETSGHAVSNTYFDYTNGSNMQKISNSWGDTWCLEGNADINFDTYPPTEAFVDTLTNPMYQFTTTMKFGMRTPEIKELQKRLKVIQTGYFGILTLRAVKKFQKDHNLTPDGIVGKLTRDELNK